MRHCFKDGMYVESARSQCVYVNAIVNRPREEGWGGWGVSCNCFFGGGGR